jgi:hypothetical protein
MRKNYTDKFFRGIDPKKVLLGTGCSQMASLVEFYVALKKKNLR